MNKRAASLALMVLILATVAVNPMPLRGYLVTLAFTFPKTLAFNMAATISVTILMLGLLRFRTNTAPHSTLLRVDALFLTYICIALTSAIYHQVPVSFFMQWLSLVAPMAGLVWITSIAARNSDDLFFLKTGMLVFAFVIVSMGFYDACGGTLPWLITKRPTGILGNRSDLATFCVLNMPLAIWFFDRELKESRSKLRTLASGLLIVELIAMILITRSRAAWLGFASMGLLTTLTFVFRSIWFPIQSGDSSGLTRPGRRVLLVTILLCLGIIIGAKIKWPGLVWRDSVPYLSTLQRLFEADRGTGLWRVQQNLVALEMIGDSPLLGFGPGSWRREVGRFVNSFPGVPSNLFNHTQVPNSEYILIATETGILGLLSLFAIATSLVIGPCRAFIRREENGSFPLVCSFFGLGVMSAFDAMSVRHESLAFVAIAAGILRNDSQTLTVNFNFSKIILHPWVRRWALLVGLLVSLIFSGVSTWGSYVLMTSPTPSSLDSLPRFMPLPPYTMIGLLNMPINSSAPCAESGVLVRSMSDYPYESGLQQIFEQICFRVPKKIMLGQENSTWARSLFFRGYAPTQGDVLKESDLQEFAHTLRDANIKYAYIFSGPFEKDGTLPEYAFSERARASIVKIKDVYPGIKILPWVGGIQNRTVKLGDPKWMKAALASAEKLLATMPVDGIHLDFEYILPGDHYLNPNPNLVDLERELSVYDLGLLEFHRRLREKRPKSFISSVVVSSSSKTKPWKKKHTLSQILDISRNVDQLSFLYYDTRINDAVEYQTGMREQLDHIKTLKMELGVRAPQYLMAIGTFVNEPELRVYRDMRLENISDTLGLMKKLIGQISPDVQLVDGLAIYCEWLTTADEWDQIKSLWTKSLTLK